MTSPYQKTLKYGSFLPVVSIFAKFLAANLMETVIFFFQKLKNVTLLEKKRI